MATFIKLTVNGTVFAGNVTASSQLADAGFDASDFNTVKSLNWGMNRAVRSGARISGHTQFDSVHFNKPFNRASPEIVNAMDRGQNVEAEIVTYSPSPEDGTPEETLKITIEQGRFTHYSVSASDEGEVIDDISIAINKLTIEDAKEGTMAMVENVHEA